MSLPPALGATCSKPCPHQATLVPSGTPGWMAGEEGLTYNRNWGSNLGHFYSVPHHCSQPPPGMAPQQEQKEGT